tara:strand:+ start:6772 stop:7302 length:531 start_codon:yes stop_codon:yes gene_type:complete
MSLDNIDLDFALGADQWEENFPQYQDHIRTCFDLIVTHVAEARRFAEFPHVEVSFLLTDDAAIQTLNRDYRGKDKATNVLSFPSLSEEDVAQYLRLGEDLPAMPIALGDIIFAWETIKREAEAQGKTLDSHFCHLCLHGILHLLGYDHIDDDDAAVMEALETDLLAKLSIDDPYQA